MDTIELIDAVAFEPAEKELINCVKQANNRAEASYWWMKGIDMKQAEELQVADKVKDVLKLLTKVDNITIDIIIQIKNNKSSF